MPEFSPGGSIQSQKEQPSFLSMGLRGFRLSIVRTADFLIQNPKHLFAVARMVAGKSRYLGSPSIALYITYPIGSREYNLIAHFDRKVSFVRVGALYDNSPHRVFNRSTEASSKGMSLARVILLGVSGYFACL